MLKIRIIPILLWKDIGLIKGKRFDSWRRVGSLLPAVKVFNARQVDELIFLDISATKEKRSPDFDLISDISKDCFMPLTVGGGIKKIEDIRQLLLSGADKVSINTSLYKNPELITKASNYFGSQCIVASIDVKKEHNQYYGYYMSGTVNSGKTFPEIITQAEDLGVGELLITSIDRDGTMEGFDSQLIKLATKTVSIPVIAAGGAGKLSDFYKIIKESSCSATAAASVFFFTEITPFQIKKYLMDKNINVRVSHFP